MKKASKSTTPRTPRKKASKVTQADLAPFENAIQLAANDHQNQSPSEEAIRLRAYELYLERGGEPGYEEEDWYRAETELKNA